MCPSLGLRSKSTCFLWPQQKMWQLISMKYFSWSFQGTSVDNIIFSIKIERDNVQLSLRSAHVDLAISSFSFNFYLVSTTFWWTSCRVHSTGLQTNMSCFEISSIYLVNYVCVGKDLNKNSLPQKSPRNPISTLKIWKRVILMTGLRGWRKCGGRRRKEIFADLECSSSRRGPLVDLKRDSKRS